MEDIYPVANLTDIITSKKASNRRKDLVDMELLEEFAKEFAASRSKPLLSTHEIVSRRIQ